MTLIARAISSLQLIRFLLLALTICCGRGPKGEGDGQPHKLETIVADPRLVRSLKFVRKGPGDALLALSRPPQHLLMFQSGKWTSVSLSDSFAVIINAGYAGDSIWLYDVAAERLIIRSPEGRWSQVLLPVLAPKYTQQVLGVLADGSIAMLSRAPARDEVPNLAFVWLATKTATRIVDSLAASPKDLVLPTADRRVLRSVQPWQVGDLVAMGSDRRSLIVIKQVSKTNPANKSAASIHLTRYSTPLYLPHQETLYVPLVALDSSRVSQWKQKYLTERIRQMMGGSDRAERLLDEKLFTPSHLAAFDEVTEIQNNKLFLERSTGDGELRWEVWSTGGDHNCLFSLKARSSWQLQDVAFGTILWMSRSPDGTPHEISLMRTTIVNPKSSVE